MEDPIEMMVVDASVATKWYLTDEDDADIASLLLDRFGNGEVALIEPQQIRSEVSSAITVATRVTLRGRQRPRRTVESGARLLADFLALGLPKVEDDDLIVAAYVAAQEYGCAFYDGLYLALAQRLGAQFILADGRFYPLIRDLPFVIWLGDYA